MKPIYFALLLIYFKLLSIKFSFRFSFDLFYNKYHWWERDQKFCYETLFFLNKK